MPPSVEPGEERNHYVSRCVPVVLKEGTTKNQKQAVAICENLFKEHHKKSKGQKKSPLGLMNEFAQELKKKKNG